MERGVWKATVHGVAKSQTNERVTECAHARTDTHSEMKELSLLIVKNPIHVVLPLKII